eukprot:1942413-Pleurochrysis_carterae.AAC.1
MERETETATGTESAGLNSLSRMTNAQAGGAMSITGAAYVGIIDCAISYCNAVSAFESAVRTALRREETSFACLYRRGDVSFACVGMRGVISSA